MTKPHSDPLWHGPGSKRTWVLWVVSLLGWLACLRFMPEVLDALGLAGVLVLYVLVGLYSWLGGQRFGLAQVLLGTLVVVQVFNRTSPSADLLPAAALTQMVSLLVMTGLAWTFGNLRDMHRTLHLQRSRLAAHQQDLQKTAEELTFQADHDPLTRLHNRRHFMQAFELEHSRTLRYDTPLTVAVLNIDHLGRINELHSHGVGDQVLQEVAGLLSASVRSPDVVARFSGGEFALLFCGTDPAQVLQVCSRMREAVASHPWNSIHPRLRVTVSGGLCSDLLQGSATRMLAMAESLMERARQQGGNRIEHEPQRSEVPRPADGR